MSKHHLCHTVDTCRNTSTIFYAKSYEVTVIKDLTKLASLETKERFSYLETYEEKNKNFYINFTQVHLK